MGSGHRVTRPVFSAMPLHDLFDGQAECAPWVHWGLCPRGGEGWDAVLWVTGECILP